MNDRHRFSVIQTLERTPIAPSTNDLSVARAVANLYSQGDEEVSSMMCHILDNEHETIIAFYVSGKVYN